MKDHRVRSGDCLTSIADYYGFFWQTLWDHQKNAALKELRKNPNTLLPGDVVHIPDKTSKVESCDVGKKHQIKLKGIPAMFRVRLYDSDVPLQSQSVEVLIDGERKFAETDADGLLAVSIPSNALRITVFVGPENVKYDFLLGHLPPISKTEGIQSRLNNLGFDCGTPDDELNEKTKRALAAFQERVGLTVTSQPDEPTLSKLEEIHDKNGTLPEDPHQTVS